MCAVLSITFKCTLLYPVSQNALWQQALTKSWDHQCQNEAMTHISRKTKSCRQNDLFLWPVRLTLCISNLFLHLIERTCFRNLQTCTCLLTAYLLMAYLQTCTCCRKIYPHVKNNFVYSLLIYFFVYTFLIV